MQAEDIEADKAGPLGGQVDDRHYCHDCANLAPFPPVCRVAEKLGARRGWRPLDDVPKRCQGYAPRVQAPGTVATVANPADEKGIAPDFAARLSPEDLYDIETGVIPVKTVQALEQAAIASEAEDLREAFEERAGILEYDAGLPRAEAELEAAKITATLARNKGCLWPSLRAALAGYPALLAELPDTAGTVDTLPLGVAKLAVLSGGRVVRQGAFTGAQVVAEKNHLPEDVRP